MLVYHFYQKTAILLDENANDDDVSYGFSVQMEELINKINNLVSSYVEAVGNIEKNIHFLQGETNV